MLWAGSLAGGWQQLKLPLPPDLTTVPRQLSRATGVACAASGAECWVTGWVRGHPLAWPVTQAPDGQLSAGDPVVLPGEPAGDTDAVALVTFAGDHPVVLTNAATPTLQLGCPGGWRALPAPVGEAAALVGAGAAVYAVTGSQATAQVSRLDAPTC
jgi:hypothetical protein